jgi:hypothetical protein
MNCQYKNRFECDYRVSFACIYEANLHIWEFVCNKMYHCVHVKMCTCARSGKD